MCRGSLPVLLLRRSERLGARTLADEGDSLDNARKQETAAARQALQQFYGARDPAKLSQIDSILAQYAGREYEVLRMLEQAAQAEHQPEQHTKGNRGLVRRFSERTTRRLSTEGRALALAGDHSPAEEGGGQASTAAAAGSGKDSTRELARKFSENTSRRLSTEGRSLALGQGGADRSPDDLDLHIELSDDEGETDDECSEEGGELSGGGSFAPGCIRV